MSTRQRYARLATVLSAHPTESRGYEQTLDDRATIVDQAIHLLESLYVHRPQKENMHAINPLRQLRLLALDLQGVRSLARTTALPADSQGPPQPILEPDQVFHRRMADIFTSLRDLHTSYLLPSPFNRYLAFLPFLVENCGAGDSERFLVSRLVGVTVPPTFREGVELRYWNGVPLRQAIERLGESQAGGNADARFALALHALTMRPLARLSVPDEHWVSIQYRGLDGASHEARFEWRALDLEHMTTVSPTENLGIDRYSGAGAYGINLQSALIALSRRQFFKGGPARARSNRRAAAPALIPTDLDHIFRAYGIPGTDYGYLRIFSFDYPSADDFIETARELLRHPDMPQGGIVVDIRGNPGGNILAAEGILQLFTPQRIRPLPMQFLSTAWTRVLCDTDFDVPGLRLRPWLQSIDESGLTGATHSAGVPITSEADANAVGQAYYGPVVLITDPNSYSASDLMAASFQDHGIGRVIGVRGRTGAGGANVWDHRLVEGLFRRWPGTPFKPLPGGVTMTLAIRRAVRVGINDGLLLEDFGVVPDVPYEMTERDILGQNEDLLAAAVRELDDLAATNPARTLRISEVQMAGNILALTVTTERLARIDLWLDNRPWLSLDVRDGRHEVRERVTVATPRRVQVMGYGSVNSPTPVARTVGRI